MNLVISANCSVSMPAMPFPWPAFQRRSYFNSVPKPLVERILESLRSGLSRSFKFFGGSWTPTHISEHTAGMQGVSTF
jgi:hypothetical protein